MDSGNFVGAASTRKDDVLLTGERHARAEDLGGCRSLGYGLAHMLWVRQRALECCVHTHRLTSILSAHG